MKKLVAFLLLAAICLSLSGCGNNDENSEKVGENNSISSGDAVANEDYFEWSLIDETHITGYTEDGLKQTELIIPKKCTKVYGLEKNTTVKHIKFENDDTVVSSFSDCTALESIELPANLTEIDSYAFKDCTSLKKIIIPAGVTKIKSNAFGDCTALEEVELSSALQTVSLSAFEDCTSLKSIKFGDSVTDIKDSAFKGCTALKEIEFGSGLKNIGDTAFKNCTALTTVKLPEGVLTLGRETFAFCDALESIYLPASIEKIEISSIAQTHNVKVYVVEGSYMDGRVAELMGAKFYDKQYQ